MYKGTNQATGLFSDLEGAFKLGIVYMVFLFCGVTRFLFYIEHISKRECVALRGCVSVNALFSDSEVPQRTATGIHFRFILP